MKAGGSDAETGPKPRQNNDQVKNATSVIGFGFLGALAGTVIGLCVLWFQGARDCQGIYCPYTLGPIIGTSLGLATGILYEICKAHRNLETEHQKFQKFVYAEIKFLRENLPEPPSQTSNSANVVG